MWDIDGNCYVDLVSALLPNVLGYCDPDVDRAISRQLGRGISFSLPTMLESELAERLTRLIPCAEMVRFGKSGSDATTAAVRVARAYTGRDHVIVCRPGYNGWHDWAIGWADNEANRTGVPEAVQDLTIPVRLDDLCDTSYTHKAAAIVIDCSKATPEHMRRARAMASRSGALLVFDEVITGFRWHIGGAQAAYGVTPDLACFSKAMGNGMPISAVVGSADIMGMFDHVFFSGTFGGETLSLAAACATIDKIEREGVIPHLHWWGGSVAADAWNIIRKRGLLDHVWLTGYCAWKQLNFSGPAVREAFLTAMLANGVLVNTAICPCFAHDEQDMETVLTAWRAAMDEVERAVEAKPLTIAK